MSHVDIFTDSKHEVNNYKYRHLAGFITPIKTSSGEKIYYLPDFLKAA